VRPDDPLRRPRLELETDNPDAPVTGEVYRQCIADALARRALQDSVGETNARRRQW
jgi:hypothetical protein